MGINTKEEYINRLKDLIETAENFEVLSEEVSGYTDFFNAKNGYITREYHNTNVVTQWKASCLIVIEQIIPESNATRKQLINPFRSTAVTKKSIDDCIAILRSMSENLDKDYLQLPDTRIDTETKANSTNNSGNKLFIGHGTSRVWLELQNFLTQRLNLSCDEFNRQPVAGITHTQRLNDMLDQACFALLVMTAEDEQVNDKYQARSNVIHEAGLFQGRLGFNKAIILLEEGCEEFSNIHGLNQIRFSKDNISNAFEEIRRVLERERIIT